MYSKKRALNATASSSVNKKKKNAEVPETSTNKKIVFATEKIKVPVTTSLTKRFQLPLRLLKRFWQPRLLPKNQRFLLTRLLSWYPLRLNQLKVIEDNCIMICTLFIKLFIFFEYSILK